MEQRVVLKTSPANLQQHGPIIKVLVGHTAAELAEAKAIGLEFPKPRAVNALIDTGASVTIINPQLADTYKLRYTGPELLTTAWTQRALPRICRQHFFSRKKPARI